MKSTVEIAGRFREVILNGTWIANTNYRHQLQGMSWELATAKVESFNTISLLAQHIHYYIAGILQIFKGGTLDIRDKFSFEFPPITSQEQWDTFLQRLWRDSEEFASLIEAMPEQQLEKGFVDEKYGTYRRNIDAMIEHAYYHLGQIALLRKMLEAR